uniref:Uncharacterized protein n=1 Tax=Utricularia reniformis TaxID=192314 RepID=A0A1Y0AYP2_9LAMI|nr:hypothetical protein AEK19_MT0302 [Utricularia reniformis]ART30271.1 hypothetical protein AEK19_MT0302 [Utricularia reniformis]
MKRKSEKARRTHSSYSTPTQNSELIATRQDKLTLASLVLLDHFTRCTKVDVGKIVRSIFHCSLRFI